MRFFKKKLSRLLSFISAFLCQERQNIPQLRGPLVFFGGHRLVQFHLEALPPGNETGSFGAFVSVCNSIGGNFPGAAHGVKKKFQGQSGLIRHPWGDKHRTLGADRQGKGVGGAGIQDEGLFFGKFPARKEDPGVEGIVA
jgi:hypothetical protein